MAIFGADDRVKQNNTLAWPNIYIAQVVSYFPDSSTLQSSGVLVGANGVLVFSSAITSQFNEWASNNNSTIQNWRATALHDTHFIDFVANVYTAVLGRVADHNGMTTSPLA